MEAKLRKGLRSRNTKLSNQIKAFSKASTAILRAAFITFWLCKSILGSHLHYAVKPVYFQLAIKIFVKVSLSLAPLFLGHFYVQLNILRSDKRQVGSCHMVTSSHFTILSYSTFFGNIVLGIWLSVI